MLPAPATLPSADELLEAARTDPASLSGLIKPTPEELARGMVLLRWILPEGGWGFGRRVRELVERDLFERELAAGAGRFGRLIIDQANGAEVVEPLARVFRARPEALGPLLSHADPATPEGAVTIDACVRAVASILAPVIVNEDGGRANEVVPRGTLRELHRLAVASATPPRGWLASPKIVVGMGLGNDWVDEWRLCMLLLSAACEEPRIAGPAAGLLQSIDSVQGNGSSQYRAAVSASRWWVAASLLDEADIDVSGQALECEAAAPWRLVRWALDAREAAQVLPAPRDPWRLFAQDPEAVWRCVRRYGLDPREFASALWGVDRDSLVWVLPGSGRGIADEAGWEPIWTHAPYGELTDQLWRVIAEHAPARFEAAPEHELVQALLRDGGHWMPEGARERLPIGVLRALTAAARAGNKTWWRLGSALWERDPAGCLDSLRDFDWDAASSDHLVNLVGSAPLEHSEAAYEAIGQRQRAGTLWAGAATHLESTLILIVRRRFPGWRAAWRLLRTADE